LYEIAFRQSCGDKTVLVDEVLERNIGRYDAALDDRKFIMDLAEGVIAKAETLDKMIQPVAPEWPLDQIARIDHLVLRMGAYELQFNQDVPPKVVINEAVELAKGFGGDNSSKFINGVLGTLLRDINPKLAAELDKINKEAKTSEKVEKA
jgi:N utilization substance protein B